MNSPEKRWTWRGWFWGFLFLLLLQAIAVFWLADRRSFKTSWEQSPAYFEFSVSRNTDERIAEWSAFRDPTLFALPSRLGFSGDAWLKYRPLPPERTNWSAPLDWQPFEPELLGDSLKDYLKTNRLSNEPLLASLRESAPPEIRIPSEPVMTSTLARIEGLFPRRELLSQPFLPSVSTNILLSNSVVTVMINAAGVVESAMPTASCGSHDSDLVAVSLARQFRFSSIPASRRTIDLIPPQFGRIVFLWHVLPPTNNLAAAP